MLRGRLLSIVALFQRAYRLPQANISRSVQTHTGRDHATHNTEQARFEDEEEEDEDDKEVAPATDEYKIDRPLESLAKFRIGNVVIPSELRQLVSSVLKDVNRKELKKNTESLIESLRGRMAVKIPHDPQGMLKFPDEVKSNITYNKDTSLAYVANRLPGAYACNYRVFDELAKRFPKFEPTSMLDYGSGPGTSVWAAKEVWPTNFKRIMAIEPSTAMTDVAATLLTGLPVRWQRYLLQTDSIGYDMVVCSYVLAELNTDKSRRQLVKNLWKQVEPGGMLVLIEHGSPLSFKVIRQIRAMMIEMDAETKTISKGIPRIIAPCPHEGVCPMGNNSWCHFAQRVVRTPLQLAAKSNTAVNFDTEKFSYLVIMKQPLSTDNIPDYIGDKYDEDNPIWKKWSRMVREPLKKGGHVIVDACTPAGTLQRGIIAKSHGLPAYKEARKTSWGDGFIINEDKNTVRASVYSRLGNKLNTDGDEEPEEPEEEQGQQADMSETLSVKERINRGITSKSKNNKKSADERWVDDLSPETRKIIKAALEAGKQASIAHAAYLKSTPNDTTTTKTDENTTISWARELTATSATNAHDPNATWLEGFYDIPKKQALDKAKKDDADLQKELEIEKGRKRTAKQISETIRRHK